MGLVNTGCVSNCHLMPVRIVNVSPKIEVDDERLIIFPPEVKGSLKPGSLDHLRMARYMRWGDNMLALIKPNTIPNCFSALQLPPNYAHPIDDSNLGSGVTVYMHHSSIQYAGSKNSFYIWKEPMEPEPVLPKNWKQKSNIWTGSGTFENIEIIRIERIPEPVVVPEPVTVAKSSTSLEKKKAYLEAEKVFVDARRAYLDDKIATLNDQLAQTSV